MSSLRRSARREAQAEREAAARAQPTQSQTASVSTSSTAPSTSLDAPMALPPSPAPSPPAYSEHEATFQPKNRTTIGRRRGVGRGILPQLPVAPPSRSKRAQEKQPATPASLEDDAQDETEAPASAIRGTKRDRDSLGDEDGEGEDEEEPIEPPEYSPVHIPDDNSTQGLSALKDVPPDTKPFYPYSTLIRYAIKGSPEQRLLLEDIYAALEDRFPWFKTANAGWKNSVRHNLSLNPSFQKVARPLTNRGKGAYWVVNDQVDPRAGIQRVRKRRARTSTESVKNEFQTSHQDGPETSAAGAARSAAAARTTETDQTMVLHQRNGDGSSGTFPNSAARMSYPFDQNQPGIQVIQMKFPITGENVEVSLSPEVDADGQPNWRSIWLNELLKLQHATAEAEKHSQDSVWYRAMIERLRVAFAPQPSDFTEEADVGEHQRNGTAANGEVHPQVGGSAHRDLGVGQ